LLPESLTFRPLVKENEDSGNEITGKAGLRMANVGLVWTYMDLHGVHPTLAPPKPTSSISTYQSLIDEVFSKINKEQWKHILEQGLNVVERRQKQD